MSLSYLSVCSGIEVAALAWVPLGWRPLLVSEIEAFPREVLRIRHGARDVRHTRSADSLALWGDFTALRMRHLRRLGIDPADIDVLVGGTPCQGFSVAGLRGSLSDPRGGLSLAFLRLAHAIQSVRVRAGKPGLIIVWENVPGVLNTPDNALGCFLGALVGADDALRSPLERGRWPSAGMVSGPRARAAWRVLDAQHFGLAQRRERVFLVASLGDGPDPAEILFEPEGLRGDPAQGEEASEDVAATLTGSLGGISGKDDIAGRVVAGTLTSHSARARGAGLNPEALVASTLAGGARNSGGYSTDDVPLIATTLRARDGAKGVDSDATDTLIPVAFGGNRQSGPIEIATALNAHGGPHGRLDFETETFIVAPRLANALRAEGFDASEDGTGRQPALIAFDCKAGGDTGFSIGSLAGTLRGEGHGGGHAAVAQASGVRRLMPVECERLQGVPEDFTRIPWRGQPAAFCPDGPRYRALGNAYPRPVLAWIGRRIETAEAISAEPPFLDHALGLGPDALSAPAGAPFCPLPLEVPRLGAPSVPSKESAMSFTPDNPSSRTRSAATQLNGG